MSYACFENIRSKCNFHEDKTIELELEDRSKKCIDIVHLNARSVVNKFDEINTFLNGLGRSWTVVCVSETWLCKETEKLFNLDGDNYRQFCTSRTDKSGGGSALYLMKHLKCKEVDVYNFKTAEVVSVQVQLGGSRKCLIIQMYRAPKNNAEFLQELEECLDKLDQMNCLTYFIGDFNMDLFSSSVNSFCESFFTLMCSHGFFPTISKATRVTADSSTLLDNIFCNDLTCIQFSGVIKSDFSDHFSIFALSDIEIEQSQNSKAPITCFNYRQIDELMVHLQTELAGLSDVTDPEEACNTVINAYKSGIEKYSYVRRPCRKSRPIKPWISPAILTSINRKNELFNLKLKTPSAQNISCYNTYKNILTRLIREAKKRYYEGEFQKYKGNSKETWNILNNLLGRKRVTVEIPSKFSGTGYVCEGDEEICNGFNDFFADIGTTLKNRIHPTGKDPLEYLPDFEGADMQLRNITEQELQTLILNLKNKGAGIDHINAKIFKKSFVSILPQLCYLFNLCINQGIFPKALKIGVIKPIYKNGDDDVFSNYRPISMLPVLSKLLEKLIYEQLLEHFLQNNLLSDQQFGFRKKHSTYMPILIYITW